MLGGAFLCGAVVADVDYVVGVVGVGGLVGGSLGLWVVAVVPVDVAVGFAIKLTVPVVLIDANDILPLIKLVLDNLFKP